MSTRIRQDKTKEKTKTEKPRRAAGERSPLAGRETRKPKRRMPDPVPPPVVGDNLNA
jgi:hypothetical protein